MFDGKEIIKPEELENTKDKSQFKTDDKYVDAFLKLMKALTGDKEYTQANAKGGVKSMCDVLQGAIEKGKIEGKIEGRIEGRIESLYYDSNKTPEEIATIVNCPIAFVEDILSGSNI